MSTLETPGWWESLWQGGMLIAPARVAEHFPQPAPPLSVFGAERLRRALMKAERDERAGPLLDTIFEEVAGLSGKDWLKGSSVDKSWSRKALGGETIRPHRVWRGPHGATLPLFLDTSGQDEKFGADPRLGVGRGRRALSRVLEWQRQTGTKLALLTNGRQIRLVHAGADYDASCEWELALWFLEGTPGPQVTALRTLLSARALSPAKPDASSPLLTAIVASRQGQAELSTELGERVRRAVETIISQVAPSLDKLVDDGKASPRDIYIAATRLIMRCVVVLFAEARELLPRSSLIYDSAYGLQALRAELERRGGGRPERLRDGRSAWPRLLALFRLVHDGSTHPELMVPRYGGGLFAHGEAASEDPVLRAVHALEDPRNTVSDLYVHRILELLCRSRVRVRQGRSSRYVEVPVDFSDLSSEYIGILYEGLLDFELKKADRVMVFLNIGDQPVLPFQDLPLGKDGVKDLFAKLGKADKSDASDEEEAESEDSAEEGADAEASGESVEEEASTAAAEQGADRSLVGIAQEWAEQAVEWSGRARPPRGRNVTAEQAERYREERAKEARRLVPRVVAQGEWFLVRWGGTRKGSGTFYTRPQIAAPTVRRALLPLLYVGDQQTEPRKPEEILALKICDPAAGSGSFLVSALRTVTEALVASLHFHGRLRDQGDGTVCRLADGGSGQEPVDDLVPLPVAHEAFDERLRARLKRYVVERCLYGVDLDPLAVELARTALWIETMDYQLPFGFLDHKIKCGNALVGTWFDRFQEYPAMAWMREGGDEKHAGVHHAANVRGKAIKAELKDRIKPELASLLEERDPKQVGFAFHFGTQTADELQAQALQAFDRLHSLPIHQAEQRARIFHEEIEQSGALRAIRSAFDLWCALWFWPADQLGSAPGPRSLLGPSPAASLVSAELARQHRFFHWELEFPDVFRGPGSGFNAIIGNPPWETQKPNSLEFFSNRDPLYRTYGKQAGISRQKELFSAEPVEATWLAYVARFKALSNWAKHSEAPFDGTAEAQLSLARGHRNGALLTRWRDLRSRYVGFSDPAHPYRHQGSGDLNTYKLFIEQSHALLAPNGSMGMLVPSGIYSDQGSGELRKLLLEHCRFTHLYAFQNERFVFEHIHHSFKMAVIHFRKGGRTKAILTRFRLGPGDSPEAHEVETELLDSSTYLVLPEERIRKFSPFSGAIAEIRSLADLTVLETLYGNGALLGAQTDDSWQLKYGTEFHMSGDSELFPTKTSWEAEGYVADEYGHWIKGKWAERNPEGETGPLELRSADGTRTITTEAIDGVALPLYQGVMVQQFDFAPKGWVRGTGLRALWEEISWEHKRPRPQYLVSLQDAIAHNYSAVSKPSIRRVARSTDARTAIACLVPRMPCGDKAALLIPQDHTISSALVAVLSSFVFDWVVRQRAGGTQVDYYLLSECVLPRSPRDAGLTRLSAALCAGAPIFAREWLKFWRNDMRWKENWAITPAARMRARAMCDALVAHRFGLTERDLGWILRDCDHPAPQINDKPFSRTLDPKGFWRVDKDKAPELRHPVLTLVAFRDLQANGVDNFLGSDGAEGWQLPERLRLADYGLGHDDRAKEPQLVASVLGPRFYDWQLAQSVEESWKECQRHAELLERIVPTPRAPTPSMQAEGVGSVMESAAPTTQPAQRATDLFGNPVATDLFGNPIPERRTRRPR